MPEIGEKRLGRDIGKQRIGQKSRFYMWAACADCGKGKWTFMRNGKPAFPRCNSCANRLNNLGKGGRTHWNYKEARITIHGYVFIRLFPNDLFYIMADVNGRVGEHRLVMAKALNRPLLPYEIVHHKDGNRSNNTFENLALLPDNNNHHIFTRAQNLAKIYQRKVANLQKENIELKNQIVKFAEIIRTYEHYPSGRVYGKKKSLVNLRYKPEGGAEIVE